MTPSAITIRDPARGANPAAARAHNERLVLALVRRHGRLAKAEIARRSGLSPQSATVITKRLEEEGLLLRGEPERGRVGQPAVPMLLNPSGAVSLGVKVGRRNAEFMAIDLAGGTLDYRKLTYVYPAPADVVEFIKECSSRYAATSEVAGLGIALPWQIWGWLDERELDSTARRDMERWQAIDVADEVARATGLPVLVCNDGTAAARAENAFGLGRELVDYVTFYVGHFVGGGVVLNHRVYDGRRGNGGALGTLPGRDGTQLLDRASLSQLRSQLVAQGREPQTDLNPEGEWIDLEPELDAWLTDCADALAYACISVASVLEVEACVIEGQFPPAVRADLTRRVRDRLPDIDTRGIDPPVILEGTIGHLARVRGAAALSLFAKYFIDD